MKVISLRQPIPSPMISNPSIITRNYELQPISISPFTFDNPNGLETIQVDPTRQKSTMLTDFQKIWRYLILTQWKLKQNRWKSKKEEDQRELWKISQERKEKTGGEKAAPKTLFKHKKLSIDIVTSLKDDRSEKMPSHHVELWNNYRRKKRLFRVASPEIQATHASIR